MEWPDTDWNSIALWHLENLVNKNNKGGEYSLKYKLNKSINAVLKIYNLSGQEIETLVNGLKKLIGSVLCVDYVVILYNPNIFMNCPERASYTSPGNARGLYIPALLAL